MLNSLEKIDWFYAVGQVNDPNVVGIKSWKEASERCTMPYWREVQIEISNLIADELVIHHKERYRLWNMLAAEINALMEPVIQRKIAYVVTENQLPKSFEESVKWDIALIGIGTEYSDVALVKPIAELTQWYLKGHFPCGWDGDFPNGRLIIY
jgi:hypothetical protein